MNKIIILSLLCFSFQTKSQTNVYFLPGQGADERLFSKIKLDSNFSKKYIAYDIKTRKMSMKTLAQSLISQIDTTQKFYLVGTSLGGMLCVELADLLKPEKVILISSAKTKYELPQKYRFQHTIPINKIIPKTCIKLGAMFLQPIVEPDRNKEKVTFESMLQKKNKFYMKQSVNLIINWDRVTFSKNIIHIHGSNDHTLPIKNIKADFIIKNGSHMMTLTNGEEINMLIMSLLVK